MPTLHFFNALHGSDTLLPETGDNRRVLEGRGSQEDRVPPFIGCPLQRESAIADSSPP
jgi:hypothetical protein